MIPPVWQTTLSKEIPSWQLVVGPSSLRLVLLEDPCVPALDANPGRHTVHDTVTHMNWLANANLAATINPDGTPNKDTRIMQDDVVAADRAVSGNGDSADSFGGGVYDGFDGGIAIAPGALAKADGHTRIRANDADIGPDEFGTVGMI
jgi:hypothetical protein